MCIPRSSRVLASLFYLICSLTWAEERELGSRIKREVSALPTSRNLTLSYADVVEKCLPSVVTIFTTQKPDPRKHESAVSDKDFGSPSREEGSRGIDPHHGSGSGIVLTAEGYLLTNNHVVEDAETIRVRIPGIDHDAKAQLIGRDPLTDVALLKIDSPGLKPITVADSKALRRGDVVLALGSPFGLEQTVTLGIVSATGRSIGIIQNGYEDFIQTDAAINPGNSGGALVDGLGRLVGMNTASYSGPWSAQGIGFAVPANLALRIAGDLLHYGHVVRGFLGVRWVETKEEEALKITGRSDLRPARIVALEAGTPAEKAGFEEGDVVLAVNGVATPTLARARYAIATMLPGSKVAFTVQRGQEQCSVEVTLAPPPSPLQLAASAPPEKSTIVLQEGLEVSALNDEAKAKAHLPPNTFGVLITVAQQDGKPMARPAPGDVITSVNGTDTKDPSELQKLFQNAPKDKPLMLRIWHNGGQEFILLQKE